MSGNTKKINVLVTGGAGYVGSVLVDSILNLGCVNKVYVIDNLLYKQESFLSHFKHSRDGRYEFIYGDVRDRQVLKKYCDKADVIIPLAAIVGFPACERNQSLASEVNYEHVKFLTDRASKDQLIIYPNTNSGYGASDAEDFCTEQSALNPISHYGITKCDAEKEVLEGANGISLRLATVFGVSPRMRIDLLVNDFVYKACVDKYIVLFQHNFKRNFIHVSDVSNAFCHFILNNYITSGYSRGEVFNVGLSSANLSKMELCEAIKQLVPDFVIKTEDFASDPDKRNYIVSNKKLEQLGWSPQFNIEDGVKQLICCYSGLKNIKTLHTNL
jgi:nucleoside-diphosphate-sugar epimerase